MEKETAQKIIVETEPDRVYEDYVCPRCKTTLQQKVKGSRIQTIYKYKYCHECGQKLDWN